MPLQTEEEDHGVNRSCKSVMCVVHFLLHRHIYIQTKVEEERRAKGNITPSQYNPDFSLSSKQQHRGRESQLSSASMRQTTPTSSKGPMQIQQPGIRHGQSEYRHGHAA